MNHPCSGHKCDGCARCLAGECCGADVVTADLPEEGSWPGTAVIAVGAWDETEEGVACHICGKRTHALWSHIRVHDVTPDAYRAYFGLACTRPLASERLRQERAARAKGRSREVLAQNRPTPEQMSVISLAREQRAEIRALRKQQFTPERQRRAALAARDKYRSDPVHRARVRRKVILARRKIWGDNDRRCTECGVWFCPLGGRSDRKTCGTDECLRAAKQRAVRKRWEGATG